MIISNETKQQLADVITNILEASVRSQCKPEKYPTETILPVIERNALFALATLGYTDIKIGDYRWDIVEEIKKGGV